METVGSILKKIIADIRVEVSQELDRNFERQAFFAKAWERRRSPFRGNGHILVDTGNLRRSISSRSDERSITFFSDLPYAAIHNEGGEIKVTARMKKYFWYRYYQTSGKFVRLKSGGLSRSRKQTQLSTDAEFWKCMALMKVGSTVKIPKRRFLGTDPELESTVRRIIEDNLAEYFENDFTTELKNSIK